MAHRERPILSYLKQNWSSPNVEELGLMKPLSVSSCSCFASSFISDGANLYGACATGVAPDTKSIRNSIGTRWVYTRQVIMKKLQEILNTTGSSSSRFSFDLSSSFVAVIFAKNTSSSVLSLVWLLILVVPGGVIRLSFVVSLTFSPSVDLLVHDVLYGIALYGQRFRSSGLNVGVPPCKSISLQGTRSKFDLACYCTVAYAVNRLHLLKPLSKSDNSLSALEVQGAAFRMLGW
ncbi:hypothetical protein Tco_0157670 [Tanacetum coccineum]